MADDLSLRIAVMHVEAEKQALRELVALLEQARRVAAMFEAAQMALPEPLVRLLGPRMPSPPAEAGVAASDPNAGEIGPTRG